MAKIQPKDHCRPIFKVGSRSSSLALVQTRLAIKQLKSKHPDSLFEIVEISTIGDKILDVSLSKTGEKSLFTKELEQALLKEDVDFVVHSLKDVQTQLPDGLVLGCIFDRQHTDDVVVMSPDNRGKELKDLEPGSVVGTSAVRRVAMLSAIYPLLKFESVRGNLNTRLAKLDGTWKPTNTQVPVLKYDALILARAGVERLGWSDRIDQILSNCMYAVGQGALTCQCRTNDPPTLDLLACIHNHSSALECVAERSLMYHLDGGCTTPIACRTRLVDNDSRMILEAGVYTVDGKRCISACLTASLVEDCQRKLMMQRERSEDDGETENCTNLEKGTFSLGPQLMGFRVVQRSTPQQGQLIRAVKLGSDLAQRLLRDGAAEILAEIKTGCQNGSK